MSQGFDLLGAVQQDAPGVVVQREVLDAVSVAYRAGGQLPMSPAAVVTALQYAPPETPSGGLAPTLGVTFPVLLPPYPTGLPRFVDSNPDIDGWALDAPGRAP